MSVVLHEFISGKHTTQILVTPQTATVGGTGTTLSDGTAVAFDGTIQTMPLTVGPSKRNIKATNSTRANHLILSDGVVIQLTALRAIASSPATAIAPLLSLLLNYDYFKITYVVVAGGKTKTISAYVSKGEYTGGHVGEGEQTEGATFNTIDVGNTDYFKVVNS